MLQQPSGNSSQFVDQELTHEFLRCENEKNPTGNLQNSSQVNILGLLLKLYSYRILLQCFQ